MEGKKKAAGSAAFSLGRSWIRVRCLCANFNWRGVVHFPARENYEKFGGVGGGGVLCFGSGLGGDCDTGGD
jgi:hypothetical protein